MGTKRDKVLSQGQHEKGVKLDHGKLRPYLVQNGFRHALKELYANGTFGANKYTDYGWEEVPNATERYLDAAERHRLQWILGEDRDSESGTHHLVAAAWSLLAVAELELRDSE